MRRHNEGRRRSTLRNKKSRGRWENKTDQELQEIYWQLKTQHNYTKQFVNFCDFLQKNNKIDKVIK